MGGSSTRYGHRKSGRDRDRERERCCEGHILSDGGRHKASDVPREVDFRCQG